MRGQPCDRNFIPISEYKHLLLYSAYIYSYHIGGLIHTIALVVVMVVVIIVVVAVMAMVVVVT